MGSIYAPVLSSSFSFSVYLLYVMYFLLLFFNPRKAGAPLTPAAQNRPTPPLPPPPTRCLTWSPVAKINGSPTRCRIGRPSGLSKAQGSFPTQVRTSTGNIGLTVFLYKRRVRGRRHAGLKLRVTVVDSQACGLGLSEPSLSVAEPVLSSLRYRLPTTKLPIL